MPKLGVNPTDVIIIGKVKEASLGVCLRNGNAFYSTAFAAIRNNSDKGSSRFYLPILDSKTQEAVSGDSTGNMWFTHWRNANRRERVSIEENGP